MEEKNGSLANEKSELLKRLEITDKEVEEQKEANARAPTRTMKNLLEKLKNDLAIKDKELQVLFTCHEDPEPLDLHWASVLLFIYPFNFG